MKNQNNIIYKSIFSVLVICCFLMFLFSCTKDSASPTFGDYPTEIGKIFTYKCATSGCHNTASYKGAANLDLTSLATLFQGSSSGSPIIPFRSDFSSLCFFINTYTELGPKNLPTMPLYANVLSKEEVKTIKDWIDNGAPDIDGNIKWADNPNRKKYYVLNQGCDVVTVFDATTQLPIRYINVGNKNSAEAPHMIRVSPDGKYWYVIFVANNILQKFKTSDDSFVSEVILGTDFNWNTLVISDDSKKAYCISWQSASRLAIVDLENMQVLHNVGSGSVFNDAHGVTLNNTNDTIYITRQTGNYIYKIDTGLTSSFIEIQLDGSGISNQTTSLDPHEIIFSPDGSKYFVTCQASNQVRVMSTSNDNLLQVITTGTFPQEITKSSITNKIYVTCSEDFSGGANIKGCVTVIDIDAYIATNYPVGYQPHGLAVDETNGYLIVSNRNTLSNGPAPHHTGICGRNGFINYFELYTMKLLTKKTEVASDPYSVAIKP